MTPVVEVGARCQSGWLRCRGLRRGSNPVVGGTVYPYHRAVSGRWSSYPLSPPRDSVVLSVWRGTELVSDRAKVTVVPSVLAGSVRCARFCPS